MNEIIFYVSVWLVGALAGTFRAIYDDSHRGISHLVSIAGVAGFLGFSIVSFAGPRYGADSFNPVWLLGIASVVGLAGKEQTELISLLWRSLLGKLTDDNPKTPTPPAA